MYLNEGFKSNVFKLFILIKIATIKSNNVNTQDKIPSISDISRISYIPDQVYSNNYFVYLNT